MGRVGAITLGLVICGLMASACSSGSSSSSASSSSGSSASSSSGSSAAPSKPALTRTTTTETIRVGHLTEIFDTPLPSDPAQASIVSGFRMGMILWDKSQEAWALVPPVTSYVTGNALTALKGTLTTNKSDQMVPGGTDRLYKTQVTAFSGTHATVTTCDDGSKFEQLNVGTGTPIAEGSVPADQQYILVTWQMVQLDGRWAISAVSAATLPDASAQPCQP